MCSMCSCDVGGPAGPVSTSLALSVNSEKASFHSSTSVVRLARGAGAGAGAHPSAAEQQVPSF